MSECVSSWRSNVAESRDAPPESLYISGQEASASSCNAEIHVRSHAYHRHISRRAEARRGAKIALELSIDAIGTQIHAAAKVTNSDMCTAKIYHRRPVQGRPQVKKTQTDVEASLPDPSLITLNPAGGRRWSGNIATTPTLTLAT